MEATDYIGPLSLVPASVAILLAFITRNTVFSLAVACLAGVILVAGRGLSGLPQPARWRPGQRRFLLDSVTGILHWHTHRLLPAHRRNS